MSIAIHASMLSSSDSKPVLGVKVLPTASSTATRRPFHLALLLDTSGSMDGDRIMSVKRTLGLLVDAMTDGDALSLVSYSTIADVLAEATVLSESTRATLRAAVDSLHAEGGTNMESALFALQRVTSNTANPQVDGVFLLTDGHINQGISSGAGLLRILGSAVRSGTPVNTLGYGSDHNATLLRDMAVRSRGSYTYADAAELIPAIIGDITAGLANEVGRDAALVIPDGWKCIELGCESTDRTYTIGTLIADKEQWVVLEATADSSPPPTVLEFTWRAGGDAHTLNTVVGDVIPEVDIAEQVCRTRVVSVFANVTERLQQGGFIEAKAALTELAAFLDASSAKERAFVIQLRAQVDEMVESVERYTHVPQWAGGIPPPPFGHPMLARGGGGGGPFLPAIGAGAGLGGYGFGGGPMTGGGVGDILSRLASNTAVLGTQRGITSSGPADLHAAGLPSRSVTGGYHFSSPMQRHVSGGMTQQYTHYSRDSHTVDSLDADDAHQP